MKTFLRTTALLAGLLLAAASVSAATPPPGYCDVQVCNKLERYTLSPTKWLKDRMGETCQSALLAKEDAVEGKVLSSESRWFQGSSINLTKSSVTRVKRVDTCTPAAPAPARK